MKLLSHYTSQKRTFNPKSSLDLKEFRKFKQTSAWKTPCPFLLEWPYTDIPSMIQDKIIKVHLSTIINIK